MIDGVSESATARIERLTRIAIALVLVAIPLRVVALGWLPHDDVRRHAAKAVSGRAWSEIVLLRPELTVDLHAGWHALLTGVHQLGAATPRAVALAAIVGAAALFLVAPLARIRRPEAWCAALAAVALLEPTFYPRLFSGRPLVLAMSALALLLLAWEPLRAERASRAALAGWTLLFALVSWAHGNWYLWLLPLALFYVAGERRAALRLAGCWAAGTALGAAATGHPVAFLTQWLATLAWSFGSHASSLELATEFQPGTGAAPLLLAVLGFAGLRRGAFSRAPLRDPAFLLAAAGWLLGLLVSRFWTDWGLPALLVWSAREISAALDVTTGSRSTDVRSRLLVSAFAAAALFLAVTVNRGDRWTAHEEGRHLETGVLGDWLPGTGGILYANSMGLFYDTFFENPQAPFRYAVGFEPGLMPPPDLEILRGIQRHGGADDAFLPWVAKLRPDDRLAVVRPGGPPPAIGTLEWREAIPGVWLGRPQRPPEP